MISRRLADGAKIPPTRVLATLQNWQFRENDETRRERQWTLDIPIGFVRRHGNGNRDLERFMNSTAELEAAGTARDGLYHAACDHGTDVARWSPVEYPPCAKRMSVGLLIDC